MDNYMPPERSLLINILNMMYNDNLRQIENLQDSNAEIRRLLTGFLNETRNNAAHYRSSRDRSNSTRNPLHEMNHILSNQYYYPLNNVTNQTYPISNIANSGETARHAREPARHARQRGRNQFRVFNTVQQPANFFDPVEIFPTPSQIENATRTIYFRDILTPNNNSCPISLEPFNDNDIVTMIRFCRHIFHRDELSAWFRGNCRCPVCRYDIRNYAQANTLYANTDQPEEQDIIPPPLIEGDIPQSTNASTSTSTRTNTNTNASTNTNTITNTNASTNALINSLTDIVLNTFINAYSGQTDTMYERAAIFDFVLDPSLNIVLDISNNIVNNSGTRHPQQDDRQE